MLTLIVKLDSDDRRLVNALCGGSLAEGVRKAYARGCGWNASCLERCGLIISLCEG